MNGLCDLNDLSKKTLFALSGFSRYTSGRVLKNVGCFSLLGFFMCLTAQAAQETVPLAVRENIDILNNYQENNKIGQQVPEVLLPGYIESGLEYHRLDRGYPSWHGQYLTLTKRSDQKNNWIGEVHHIKEFGQAGTFFGLTNIHDFNEDWYTSFSIGKSDRSDILQSYSFNFTAFRKFLDKRQLIGSLGVQKYWWRTHNQNLYLIPGFVYYFESPWIVEGGVELQQSMPGNIKTAYPFIVLTQGKENEHYFIARFAWGREGYQPVVSNDIGNVKFKSHVLTVTWRNWVDKNWGINLSAEAYRAASAYNRNGVSVGLFFNI